MTSLKAGDRVELCLKNSAVVNPHDAHDETKSFEIVATDPFGYYLYSHEHANIRGTHRADAARCRKLGIDLRFVDEEILYITEAYVRRSTKMDGVCCARCKDFVMMAVPNQPDEKTFLCYNCRNYPYR